MHLFETATATERAASDRLQFASCFEFHFSQIPGVVKRTVWYFCDPLRKGYLFYVGIVETTDPDTPQSAP